MFGLGCYVPCGGRFLHCLAACYGVVGQCCLCCLVVWVVVFGAYVWFFVFGGISVFLVGCVRLVCVRLVAYCWLVYLFAVKFVGLGIWRDLVLVLCDLVLNWWWSLILCGCWCFGHARFGFGGLGWFCDWWCGALFGVFACG